MFFPATLSAPPSLPQFPKVLPVKETNKINSVLSVPTEIAPPDCHAIASQSRQHMPFLDCLVMRYESETVMLTIVAWLFLKDEKDIVSVH